MNLAFIAGPHAVRHISIHGDFDFCLAHIAEQDLDDSLQYNSYFRDQAATGRDVILDNAAYELDGQALGMDRLIPLIEHVNPTIVVAPDYYRNPDRTLRETREFVQELRKHRTSFSIERIMGVAHGSTAAEVLDSVWRLKELVDIVAVSKLLIDDLFSWLPEKSGDRLALTRNELCYRIEADTRFDRMQTPWFYLLGMSEPKELRYHHRRDWIWGNDSTSCLVHGMHNIIIPEYPESLGDQRVLQKLDFLERPLPYQLRNAQKNIDVIRRIANFRTYGP